jgi:hypothetical protein
MKISVIDASNYFKGLLLLIGKDRRITEAEAKLVKRIGISLGFEKEFCENAIHDILVNNYIADEPPVFSSKELAEKFIKDGLVVAASDNEMHSAEIEWLKTTAKKNGIETRWVLHEKDNLLNQKDKTAKLEADSLTVTYS